MSQSILTLTFSKQPFTVNQFSKSRMIKRGLRCRPFPCEPCKSSPRIKSLPTCEKACRKGPKCSAWDRRRDPNLCSYWVNHCDTPVCCKSADPDVQKIPFMPEFENEETEVRMPTYPHKPWPTFRSTPWSPTAYITPPCASGHCKLLDFSKIPIQIGISRFTPSRPPLSKQYSSSCKPPPDKSKVDLCKAPKPTPDPCKPKEDPCKPKVDPCKQKPDPCKPKPNECNTPPSSCCSPPPAPPSPPPMCPPKQDSGCNMNLWSHQGSQKVTKNPLPPFEDIKACIDEETQGKPKTYRFICLFGLLPLIAISGGIILQKANSTHEPRPEYIQYPYMYIRSKKFPWGDGNHTLFHNPRVNPVPPDGYEVPDPYAENKGEE